MGKAQKLKEQRKLEREQKQAKKKSRKKLIVRMILGLFLLVIVFSVVFFGKTYIKNNWFNKEKATKSEQSKGKEVKNTEKKYDKAPEMMIDKNKKYIAKIETNKGNFEVTLDAKVAPKTVNNFVFLARDKFYDGLTFHRIVKDFMVQGGDPKGDGTGGPGYTIPAEISLKHLKGAIATARQGDQSNPKRDSSGSQFFVDLTDQPSLDQGGYTVFGYVTSGMNTVEKIGLTSTSANGGGEQSKPNEKVTINKITIEER